MHSITIYHFNFNYSVKEKQKKMNKRDNLEASLRNLDRIFLKTQPCLTLSLMVIYNQVTLTVRVSLILSLPIIHSTQQVLQTTASVYTELI